MSFSRWIGVLGLGSLAALVACQQLIPSTEMTWRSAREDAVRRELSSGAMESFTGLRFFAYDPAYTVRAMIDPVSPPQGLRMAASNGETRSAHRIGRVSVRFPHGQAVLTIYRLDDMAVDAPDDLFLPFRDAGAGTSTYGAGRYVEVRHRAGGVVEIDFNRAYNPDCAYKIAAPCPITPAENTLPFLVEAGEMIPAGL
jgi:uncharacterized protein